MTSSAWRRQLCEGVHALDQAASLQHDEGFKPQLRVATTEDRWRHPAENAELNTPTQQADFADATVFVVDDDVSVREALNALIETAGWNAICFASAEAFLDCPPAGGPNCLILDVGLPDLSGLDLQVRMAVERSDMPIIFITGYGDVPMSVRAMKAGAAEFLIKPFGEKALLDAVDEALDRSRRLMLQLSALKGLEQRYATLSRRERQVMALVVSGFLNKQVAAVLGISEITVKAHRGRMMDKMRARSLADLVTISVSLGIEGTVEP